MGVPVGGQPALPGVRAKVPLDRVAVAPLPLPRKNDPGQSYDIVADSSTGTWTIDVHEGDPYGLPTRVGRPGEKQVRLRGEGRGLPVPSCGHVHPKDVHTRLATEGFGQDELLVVAEQRHQTRKVFRAPTDDDLSAIAPRRRRWRPSRRSALFPAVPGEPIPPGNTWTIQPPSMALRPTATSLTAARRSAWSPLPDHRRGCSRVWRGLSVEYTAALTGYAASVLARKLRRDKRLHPSALPGQAIRLETTSREAMCSARTNPASDSRTTTSSSG